MSRQPTLATFGSMAIGPDLMASISQRAGTDSRKHQILLTVASTSRHARQNGEQKVRERGREARGRVRKT